MAVSLTRLTLSNLSWVGLLRATLRFQAIVRTVILARLLTPIDFGIFGIAVIAVALTEMITETGINVVLIQKRDSNSLEKFIDTAFVVSILRGLLISLVIVSLAPFLANFFNNPQATSIVMAIALVPFIKGFINPAIVSFQKQLLFKKEFTFRALITLTDAVVAITTAYLTRSPYSLVVGMLAAALTEVTLSHVVLTLKPRFALNISQAKEVLGAGKWVTLMGVFGYITNTAPDISIGRLLPTASLGIYQMAYRLSFLPIDEITETFNKVAFPTYSRLLTDPPRLKRAFLKTALTMFSLALPITALISILAKPITLLLLGPQWIDAIVLMRTLPWVSLITIISTPLNPLFLAVRKQKYLSAITFIQSLILYPTLFYVISNQGIAGIPTALAISFTFTLPLRWYLGLKTLRSIT